MLSRNIPPRRQATRRDSPDTYVTAASVLRLLHAALRDEPADLAVVPPLLPEIGSAIEHCLGMSWPTVTSDEHERDLVFAAASVLANRLPDLSELPSQLTHGDYLATATRSVSPSKP